ncbi:MAG TPA: hypothetical protein PLS29_06345 [Acidimicrobiales bacterium]|nr:hypothetical protein [Acidimicrobiales bacterium]
MAAGVLVLLGSGETAPGMTRVHREVLSRVTDLRAVNLDTPYGFQLNVPQMSQKLEEYFATSLQVTLSTLHLPSFARASEVERALFKERVRGASYVFAGPGSPTWALAQWAPLALGEDLTAVLDAGGTVCLASAAALTAGALTAPIYEIYKVGVEEPAWVAGLDLVSAFGLRCVVIPHFDNAEGQNYDTRFCYLGEPRLDRLESQLPTGVATLGVDEHTAAIFDRESDTLGVRGRARVHWRLAGKVRSFAAGDTIALDELRRATPVDAPRVERRESADSPPTVPQEPLGLAEVVAEGGPDATRALARLVQLAEGGGEGTIDPTALVEGVLAARREARAAGQYALADRLRGALVDAGVEVQDGPSGTTWSLRLA